MDAKTKVDNAIILAAGLASRCRPLSEKCPKGLFSVRGEVLIERQIEQIINAGIPEIILVAGYLAEKFDYLADKYGVKLLYNPDYAITNNMSSIWCARNYLGNSYICGSDNWFNTNVFTKYCEESYFSSLYSEEYVDEYCIEENSQGRIVKIQKGGAHCWYTLGEIFLNSITSEMILSTLYDEYSFAKTLIIDDFCIRHIDDFDFKSVHRNKGDIYEFDTIDDFCEFDESFIENNRF